MFYERWALHVIIKRKFFSLVTDLHDVKTMSLIPKNICSSVQ